MATEQLEELKEDIKKHLDWVTPCLTIDNFWDICPACEKPILCCNICGDHDNCATCKYENLVPITQEITNENIN